MYTYDEKAAFERRRSTRRHIHHSPCDSRSSYCSSRTSFSEEYYFSRGKEGEKTYLRHGPEVVTVTRGAPAKSRSPTWRWCFYILAMEKFDEKAPPPYAHVFYNTIDDKPLPPLPFSQTRRVRFELDKPLPPLPQDSDRPTRKTSNGGEYACWSKIFEMSDAEYDAFAREKETLG